MKTIITQTIAGCTCLLAMFAMTTTATADEYDHIDRLAVRIQSKTRQLIKETVHYRHTPNYRAMVAETTRLYRAASHIHDVTHFEGNLIHLESDLRDLDRAFHRLEDLFDRTEHGSTFGNGHIHGNTAHVKRLLNSIEDSIHHIQDDVTQLRRAITRRVRVPHYRPAYSGFRTPVRLPVYPSTGGCPDSRYGSRYGGNRGGNFGRSGIGFSIGGGSSQINFRF